MGLFGRDGSLWRRQILGAIMRFQFSRTEIQSGGGEPKTRGGELIFLALALGVVVVVIYALYTTFYPS